MGDIPANAKIKAKATMGAVKIHGPNSPQVLAGDVKEGHQEHIEVTNPEQIIEITYEQACQLWGTEQADKLFEGVPKEG